MGEDYFEESDWRLATGNSATHARSAFVRPLRWGHVTMLCPGSTRGPSARANGRRRYADVVVPTQTVKVRFSKWNGDPHWAFDMHRIGEDAHGTWLWAPGGTRLQRGSEPPISAKHGFVKVITRGGWWTALWNEGPWGDGRTIHTYVDVITPAEWDGDTVRMIDLDLDIVRRSDGAVEVDDEDEFEEHRIAMAYPEHIVAKARTEAARLALAVEGGAEPFGAIGDRWLELARGR
mgnify:FL=1